MKQAKKDQNTQLAKTNYSERDIARIAAYITKVEDDKPPKFKGGPDDKKIYSADILNVIGLSEACGTVDDELAGTFLDQKRNASYCGGGGLEGVARIGKNFNALGHLWNLQHLGRHQDGKIL